MAVVAFLHESDPETKRPDLSLVTIRRRDGRRIDKRIRMPAKMPKRPTGRGSASPF